MRVVLQDSRIRTPMPTQVGKRFANPTANARRGVLKIRFAGSHPRCECCCLISVVDVVVTYAVAQIVYRASAMYHASYCYASSLDAFSTSHGNVNTNCLLQREMRVRNLLDGARTLADGAWTFPMELAPLPMKLEPSPMEFGALACNL